MADLHGVRVCALAVEEVAKATGRTEGDLLAGCAAKEIVSVTVEGIVYIQTLDGKPAKEGEVGSVWAELGPEDQAVCARIEAAWHGGHWA